MPKDVQEKAIRISTIISFAWAMLLAGAFLAATSLRGDYNAVTRYGGAAWVLLLALVVALPTVAPIVKRRMRGRV